MHSLADGRFVVTWTDRSASGVDTSIHAVRGQVFAADGSKSGVEFLVNTTTASIQHDSSVTALADGSFVVTWTDYSASGGDTVGAAIRSQVFDATRYYGDGTGETVTGGTFADTLYGYGGDDTLNGGGGDDHLGGGTSSDTLRGDAGNDRLFGDLSADFLFGGDGNDLLDGGASIDQMTGGTGNDSYRVDNASAVIVETAGGGTLDVVMSSVDYVLKAGVDVEHLRTESSKGTAGIDLTGNALAQTLTGNAGGNILDGKGGNDTLQGFGGKDVFVFSSTLGAGNIDTVADFSIVDDIIRLENAIFGKLTATGVLASSFFRASGVATAAGGNDFVLYDTDDGKLFYDADGNGAGARVHFATLTGAPAISAADFVVI